MQARRFRPAAEEDKENRDPQRAVVRVLGPVKALELRCAPQARAAPRASRPDRQPFLELFEAVAGAGEEEAGMRVGEVLQDSLLSPPKLAPLQAWMKARAAARPGPNTANPATSSSWPSPASPPSKPVAAMPMPGPV